MSGIGEQGQTRHVVLPYGPDNAAVRTRALHWVERLRAAGRVSEGSVVLHGPGWRTGSVPRGSDVLLLRNIGRLTRGGRERRLLKKAGLAVYDLDDGLPWDDGNLPGLGRWWKRPFPRSLVAERAAGAADRMIVGNDVLAEWAAPHCRDVRIVPTCVEPGEYRRRTAWEIGDTPVIGWIGSPATEPYLADIADALEAVHRRTGARLHMISGGSPPHPRLAPFTTASRWSATSTAEIAGWDVGLMPLRDGVYERAKCGYKLLQYAASAVPAVGSPVGVNATLLTAMDGLAATTGAEWTEALMTVVTEPAARRAARASAALSVADAYSYATWQDAWIDAVGW